MAIEDKTVMMAEAERKLREVITAADLEKVMRILADTLTGYSVERMGNVEKNDDLLDAYVSALRIQGRSGKTVERYRYLITRMMQTMNCRTREVTVYHLRQYLAQEKERGVADSTLEGVRQVMSAYFGWLRRENLIEQNPTLNLGAIKCRKKVMEVYSDVDLERMKLACSSMRDRALISFLASTGCRISEVIGLDREDVDLNTLECTVLGKGNKERLVYLDAVTAMMLREYMRQRTDKSRALFTGKGTDRITPGGVRAMLKRTAQRAGLEHVHPHKFRRTLATNLIRRGMPIQEVATILGHDKLDTTMKYVVMDRTAVKQDYRKYA